MFSTQKMKRLLLFLVACLSTQAAQAQAGIVAGQTVGMQVTYSNNVFFYTDSQPPHQSNQLDVDGDGTDDLTLYCEMSGVYVLELRSLVPAVWQIASAAAYAYSIPLASPINASSNGGFWAGFGTLHRAIGGSRYTAGNWNIDTLTRYIGIRQLRNGLWRYGYLKTKRRIADYSSPLYVTAYAMESVVTGVSQQQLTGIEVYPNPVVDQLQIVIPERTVAQVEIKDLTGRVQLCQALPPGPLTHSISLAGLSAGTYLVRLHTAGGTLTRRISKL